MESTSDSDIDVGTEESCVDVENFDLSPDRKRVKGSQSGMKIIERKDGTRVKNSNKALQSKPCNSQESVEVLLNINSLQSRSAVNLEHDNPVEDILPDREFTLLTKFQYLTTK